jgi:hypothetical protein
LPSSSQSLAPADRALFSLDSNCPPILDQKVVARAACEKNLLFNVNNLNPLPLGKLANLSLSLAQLSPSFFLLIVVFMLQGQEQDPVSGAEGEEKEGEGAVLANY